MIQYIGMITFVEVYIHFVWTTRNEEHYLASSLFRHKVQEHIRQNAKDKGLIVEAVSVQPNHCHCLIAFKTNQTIEKLMQLIKGESSFWINEQKRLPVKFEWENTYYAVSVGQQKAMRIKEQLEQSELTDGRLPYSIEREWKKISGVKRRRWRRNKYG